MRDAKSNSNVSHFDRDLATEYGKDFKQKSLSFCFFFHIMKCTSLLTSQHDCLDLCNQMVMREEGVSRVAKTNSNVPHFARDLATK